MNKRVTTKEEKYRNRNHSKSRKVKYDLWKLFTHCGPMRSKSRSRRRSCFRQSVSPANPEPGHFMKVILPEPIHGEKMRIPKEFIRRFGNELSSEATITVPDGLVWKMGLKKSADEVWLCNGWREFVKHYSICYGFFLVFKYVGNSNFNVVIFDMSAAEIYYPCKNQSNNKETNFEKQHSKAEWSRKRSRLDHCGYSKRSKRPKLENEEIIDVDDVNGRSHSKPGKNVSYNPHEHSRKHGKDGSRQGSSSQMDSIMRKKLRAIEAAQKFKPENPSFTAIIKPSHMTYCYMDVPALFSTAYLSNLDSVKLQESNGQQWVVNCHRRHSSSIRRMGKGWPKFARAKNLREGDVCVFELIKRKNVVLKVTIFTWS